MGRKILRGDFSHLEGFFFLIYLFMDLRLTPSSSLSILFDYKMVRGHKDVSTSQVGRMRCTPRETPTANSLIAAMSIKELRLYSQIYAKINLETSDGATTTTVEEADNAVYFTRE